jgi:hypothetical protein
MRQYLTCALALFHVVLLGSDALAADPVSLKYKFTPGETLRWQVTEQVEVKTTMRGTTQVAKTAGTSIKVWKVGSVRDGNVTFEHMVESVNMKMWLTGRDEVEYNSKKDAKPPEEYAAVAKNVGHPLSEITMDSFGTITKRKSIVETPQSSSRTIALPLPPKPVTIGQSWTRALDIPVRLKSGAKKTIKARHKFTLQSVADNIAVIQMATQILSPIDDAEIESQIIQRKSSGTARFDITRGRFVSLELDLDDAVHHFQGPDSLMKYKMKFSEKLLPAKAEVAERTDATSKRE